MLQYRKVLNSATGKMEIVWGGEEEEVNNEENEEDKMKKLR